MGKEFRMGVIALAVVLAISVAYTAFYLSIGLQRVDRFNSILLVVLWVVAVAGFVAVLRWRALVREELVRRYYLSSEWVYNHEIGYAPISKITPSGDAYEFITFAAESLAHMSYGFEVADPPDDFKPQLVVASRRFRFHESGDGIVIDRWRGVLQRVQVNAAGERVLSDAGSFANAKQLARLLEEEGVFDLESDALGDAEMTALAAAGDAGLYASGPLFANKAAFEAEIEARAEAEIARVMGDAS